MEHIDQKDYSIYCGDCMEVFETLEDQSVDAIITDPPYGMNYQSRRRPKERRTAVIAGDTEIDLDWLVEAERVLKPNGTLFVFCGWQAQSVFEKAIASIMKIKSHVVWDRVQHGMGALRSGFAPTHDVAWFAVKHGSEFSFPGKRPKSVYRYAKPHSRQLLHPTQKPIELMRAIVLDLTVQGDLVLDPFMGSGTTGVACLLTGRKFIGVDVDEQYYRVAANRFLIGAEREE